MHCRTLTKHGTPSASEWFKQQCAPIIQPPSACEQDKTHPVHINRELVLTTFKPTGPRADQPYCFRSQRRRRCAGSWGLRTPRVLRQRLSKAERSCGQTGRKATVFRSIVCLSCRDYRDQTDANGNTMLKKF